MVNDYCGNSPAGSGKSRADLRQALAKEKDRKKRSSGKAKQPYDYLDFARRFHRGRYQIGCAPESAPTYTVNQSRPAPRGAVQLRRET
jgi:hypothetical protein